MKSKRVAETAERQIDEIAEFIASGNIAASERYYRAALSTFQDASDSYLPVRASEHLPDTIRKLQVPGFRGYTLRLMYAEGYIALIAAFRPGLTDSMMDRHTRPGIAEFHRDTPT